MVMVVCQVLKKYIQQHFILIIFKERISLKINRWKLWLCKVGTESFGTIEFINENLKQFTVKANI